MDATVPPLSLLKVINAYKHFMPHLPVLTRAVEDWLQECLGMLTRLRELVGSNNLQ